MHPRTIAILIAAILLASFGLRFVVFHFELLPVTEQALLKKATALTISYSVVNNPAASRLTPKTLKISSPEELADLFAVLEMRGGRFRGEKKDFFGGGPGGWAPSPTTVTFHFPDGSTRPPMTFEAEDWLGHQEVDRRFYRKLCDLVSRAEGRPVDLLRMGAQGNDLPPGRNRKEVRFFPDIEPER